MQGNASRIQRSIQVGKIRDERGIVALIVIYGLSIFSVLALTMLADVDLEKKFRTTSDFDLHVVLFGGRSDSETVVGRLNLPTLYREQAKDDASIEIRIPVPVAADTSTSFGAGSTYSVRLSKELTVCCDTGDGACANRLPDVDLPVGSVNRVPGNSKTTVGEATLTFDLSTFQQADNLSLDTAVASGDHILVKAAKDMTADSASTLANADLACKVDRSGTVVASGTLALQSPIGVAPAFMGKLQLKYGLPASSQSVPSSK